MMVQSFIASEGFLVRMPCGHGQYYTPVGLCFGSVPPDRKWHLCQACGEFAKHAFNGWTDVGSPQVMPLLGGARRRIRFALVHGDRI